MALTVEPHHPYISLKIKSHSENKKAEAEHKEKHIKLTRAKSVA